MSERTKTRSLRAPRRVRAYLAANAERPALLLAASEEAAERYAREAEVLRQSEHRFRSLLQNAADIIAVLDAEGVFTKWCIRQID